jgi:hypothetical protein
MMSGCENTDVTTAVDAERDAVKAFTLSEQDVQNIAKISAQLADKQHAVAPTNNKYAKRLSGLVPQQFREGNLKLTMPSTFQCLCDG